MTTFQYSWQVIHDRIKLVDKFTKSNFNSEDNLKVGDLFIVQQQTLAKYLWQVNNSHQITWVEYHFFYLRLLSGKRIFLVEGIQM